jgi:hypothetical protein
MREFRAKRSEAVSCMNRVSVSKGLLKEVRVIGRDLVRWYVVTRVVVSVKFI